MRVSRKSMTQQKTGAPIESAPGYLEQYQCKDTKHSRTKQTIAALFTSGRQLTAVQINQLTNQNDARKHISDLRRRGMNIADYRLPNRQKVYFIKKDAL